MDAFYAYYLKYFAILQSRISRIFPATFSPVDSCLILCPLVYAVHILIVLSLTYISPFFECALGSKATYFDEFKESIWELIRAELLPDEIKDKKEEVILDKAEPEAELDVMDEDPMRSAAAFLAGLSDRDTTSSTTTASSTTSSNPTPGRKRKKFGDGMSDDTLARRFATLDTALNDETGI